MPYNLRTRKPNQVSTQPPRASIKKQKSEKAPEKPTKEPKVSNKRQKVEKASEDEEPEPNSKKQKLEENSHEPAKPSIKKQKVEEIKEEVAQPKVDVKSSEVIKRQYAFGADSCGELGLGKIGASRKQPILVKIDEPITQVACGPMHTISLSQSGKVYSYGCNDEGALGRVTDGEEDLEATPTHVPIKGKVIKITAGDSHSAALTDKHEVFIWGNFRDEHGSVGLTPESEAKPTYDPIKILADKKLKDIASGSNHMLILDDTGKVYSFGVGAQGQLGRIKPEVSDDADHDKKEPCEPITGEKTKLYLTPLEVSFKEVDPNREFICDAVFAGNFSSFATNTDKKKNRLAAWGLNNYFQLGYKGQKNQLVQHIPKRSTFTCSTSMISVACGQHHTLFLTRTGRVYAAGRTQYGMLGIKCSDKDEICPAKQVESLGNSIKYISAGINTSFAVSDEGKLFSWGMGGINLGTQGDEDLMEPTEVTSLESKKVLSVSAGGAFTAVVLEE